MFIELTKLTERGMRGHRDFQIISSVFKVRPEKIDGYYDGMIIMNGKMVNVAEKCEEIEKKVLL